MEIVSENKCFDGVQGVYKHRSTVTNCDMTFAVFMPSAAEVGPVPVLWYLSGLTCTHENAMTKAGAQVWAEEAGIALVFPDTSPRGQDVADDDAYDLGQGAGFYVNATQSPWDQHFKMWDYIATELPALIEANFEVDMSRQAITGHSMGGHGALTLAMGLPDRFRSVSALSPICHPTASDWGRKQLGAYLGSNEDDWAKHDATLQMQSVGFNGPILVDVGTDDQFIDLLQIEALAAAAASKRAEFSLNFHKGYDHSYFFVSSVMEDHINFHADALYRD